MHSISYIWTIKYFYLRQDSVIYRFHFLMFYCILFHLVTQSRICGNNSNCSNKKNIRFFFIKDFLNGSENLLYWIWTRRVKKLLVTIFLPSCSSINVLRRNSYFRRGLNIELKYFFIWFCFKIIYLANQNIYYLLLLVLLMWLTLIWEVIL